MCRAESSAASSAASPFDLPAGYGEFWYSTASSTVPSNTMGSAWLADGAHLFGRLDYKRDPLWVTNANVAASCELAAARRPPSATNRYRSAPAVDLRGTVAGWQGLYEIPWHADDKWCNCSLTLQQTVVQLVPSGPLPFTILGANSSSWRFIHMENHYGVDQQVHTFNGWQPIPSVDFTLRFPGLSIWAWLTVRFDIGLEGDASLSFSPGPTASNSVVVALNQWKVQAL